MTELHRRRFLQSTSALGSSLALTGCGGGGAMADAAAAPLPAPAPPPAPAPTPAPPPAPAPAAPPAPAPPAPAPVSTAAVGLFTGAMQFSLLSPQAVARAPFCLGFAFRRGDVPAGAQVVSGLSGLQVTPRSTWPDGSLKLALLCGVADLAAEQALTVRLSAQAGSAAPAAPALGLAELKATGISAEVDAGSLGRAAFAAADWDTPFQTWVSGPQMSSWVYRKPVGSDAHLVAWLEVRLFAGGAVEVLPWVENGYLTVPEPANRAATYRFRLGGQERFSAAIDLPHHCRSPLVSGSALSYWLGADPQVLARQDLAHLQATELVPSYFARPDSNVAAVKALATTWAPLARANLVFDGDNMASTGYQTPIGLLPECDVLYLTVDSAHAWGAVLRNGFAAGRWGIHYRDERTQRPIRLSQYPTLVINGASPIRDLGGSSTNSYTPKPAGTASPTWDCAHSPSVGYLAYLLTGRWYFMEQVQFAATVNYLTKDTGNKQRRGAQGLARGDYDAWQTRASAWDLRSLVQALTVTPDSDAVLQGELRTCVEANIQFFHATYITQPNNPWGWVQTGEGYGNPRVRRHGASWQQDFVTAVFGHALALGLPISAARQAELAKFFTWKARSVVSRLGSSKEFWYVNAAPYTVAISPADWPDYDTGKGPWYATEAEIYAATYASAPAWLGKVEGQLAAEFMPGERSFWGNLMPALAYAVRHGAPGALAAYQRVMQAGNWPTLRNAFNQSPVWSVTPALLQPAWLAGKPLNEWFEIPGTAGAGGAAIEAFSGMAFNEITQEVLIAAAGGHLDSNDNRVVSLRLADDSPRWVQRLASSTTFNRDAAYNPDGLPASRHLYSSLHFVPQLNRLMLIGARAVYGAAFDHAKVDGFNLDTNRWDPAGTWPDAPAGVYGAALDRSTGEIYCTAGRRWSPQTRAVTPWITQGSDDFVRWPMCVDSRRREIFTLQWGDGQGYDPYKLSASRTPMGTGRQVSVRFNPSAALDTWMAEKPSYAGMDYDPENDRFLFYAGMGAAAGRVYVIKPNDSNLWDMSLFSYGAGSVKPAGVGIGGVHNRFRYVPALKGFVLLANGGANLYFLRTA